LIKCQNIGLKYGEAEILSHISFNLSQGESVAILGQSGSGKSSFLNILSLLANPTSGQYFLDGQDVSKLTEESLCEIRNKKIGIVFQKFFLVPYLNLLANVLLPLKFRKDNFQEDYSQEDSSRDFLIQEAKKNIVNLGLEKYSNHLPHQLSGGQQQRACIARALVMKPKILFADEPTGNLDSRNRESVLEIFRDLQKQGQSIVLVTHDLHVASECHRIITIEDGKIVHEKK